MGVTSKLRAVVVGLRMGMHHAILYSSSDAFELVGLCDLDPERLLEAEKQTGCSMFFSDYPNLLRETRPDIVCIATPTALHARMVMEAAHAGVRAIYCEKPMATSFGEALQMQDVCREWGVLLVIGHQRRVSSVLGIMREAIEDGLLGEIVRLEGSCPGDLLSDGTHLLDSLHFLNAEIPPDWVLGQVYRGRPATQEELARNPYLYHGNRYGHVVEEGACAVFSMKNGVRIELSTGTLWRPEDGYHHLEVHGTRGTLVRNGDAASPSLLFVQNGKRQPFGNDPLPDNGLEVAHRLLAQSLHTGSSHPMDATHALGSMEMLMGVYESARVRDRILFPLKQTGNPLELMTNKMTREGET